MARGARPILYGPRAGLSPGTFPGQPGNPVGFAAAPSFPGLTTSTWPPTGALASNQTYSFYDFNDNGTGATTSQSTKYISTTGLVGGSAVNNVTFIGCRFGCSNPWNNAAVDCITNGSTNITWSYCTFSPSPTRWLIPPSPGWPSGTVGNGLGWSTPSAFTGTHPSIMVPYQDGPEFHLNLNAPLGSVITLDHCELWGSGDNISVGSFSFTGLTPQLGQINVTDCWIHDNREGTGPVWSGGLTYHVGDVVFATDANEYYCIATSSGNNPTGGGSPAFWAQIAGSTDHSNGIIPGGNPTTCNHVLVRHCTIASIGNTNALAFQNLQANRVWNVGTAYGAGSVVAGSDNNFYFALSGTTGVDPTTDGGVHWRNEGTAFYNDIQVKNCYLSGYGNNTDMGSNTPGNINLVYTDNIIATDLVFGSMLHADYSAQFTSSTNLWRRNKFRCYPGDTWTTSGPGGILGASNPNPASTYDGFYIWPDGTLNASDWTH